MNTKWCSVKDTGNSVANFSTRMRYCDFCHSSGEVLATKEELRERLIELRGVSIKTLLKVYHHWKKTGNIQCPECEGLGSWEQWR